jgi:hypothetical protein
MAILWPTWKAPSIWLHMASREGKGREGKGLPVRCSSVAKALDGDLVKGAPLTQPSPRIDAPGHWRSRHSNPSKKAEMSRGGEKGRGKGQGGGGVGRGVHLDPWSRRWSPEPPTTLLLGAGTTRPSAVRHRALLVAAPPRVAPVPVLPLPCGERW